MDLQTKPRSNTVSLFITVVYIVFIYCHSHQCVVFVERRDAWWFVAVLRVACRHSQPVRSPPNS